MVLIWVFLCGVFVFLCVGFMWFNLFLFIGYKCKYYEFKDVKEVLSGYGKFKSKIIRFKYKFVYDFVGLVNGKRLVKRVLEKKFILYLLRIVGEW